MKKLEFVALCEKYLIHPTIALENQLIVDALAARDDKRVIELLETEY